MEQTKILMVCLGNICRSPLAEGILKSKVEAKQVFVDSAGTGAYHVGNLPDVRSIEIAKQNGIDITDQSARKITATDLTTFDYIYAMDVSNYRNILKLAKTDAQRNKVRLILNEQDGDKNNSVPDPYYGGADGFNDVYHMLDAACSIIANKLER